jgi:hypothetical protein
MTSEQLEKFDAEIIGQINKATALRLSQHVQGLIAPPLTRAEVRLVLAAMAKV